MHIPPPPRHASLLQPNPFDLTKPDLFTAFIGNNGGWSEWSTWSTCSAECGVGVQTRERACNNPQPTGRGSGCIGDNQEERECHLAVCKGEFINHYWKRSCWNTTHTVSPFLRRVLICTVIFVRLRIQLLLVVSLL